MSQKSKYNTTDLDPEATFTKHIFHRDQFAHYLRWSHILKEVKIGEKIVDFGCGKGELLEVLYRNRYKPKMYTGLDIRKKTIEDAKNTFKMLTYANFVDTDLVKPDIPLDFNATIVVCFEVVEHIGKQNIQIFLKNMRMCGGQDATYYLSTPNHDPDVGAAGNHTYDSGDGRGVDIQEFDHFELQEHILKAGFKIVNKFGTFASQRDYKESLNSWQVRMFEELHKYYDSNLLSNLMAPVIEPELARNVLWVLKRK